LALNNLIDRGKAPVMIAASIGKGIFARNAGHVDYKVKQQTLPEALQWLWKGYLPVRE